VQAGAPALHRTLPRELDLIIVNHNTRDLLAACLRSVRENSFTGAMRIIVVDSASSDGSAEKAAADFPEVEVIALPDNRGFGHAANVGLRMASGETAFVLNADTELTPSLLGGLYDELHADPVIGAVAPRHLGTDGQIQLTCGGQVTIRSEWARRQRHLAKNPVEPPVERDVAWLSGSALMLKREALRRAGLFDERFNLYFEDIDLCLRIGAAGFAVRYVPTLTVKHVGGASTVLDPQRADFEYRRSQLLFWRKHAGSLARLAVRAWVALRYLWLARSNDAPHAKRVLALLWKGTP
jgi:GT2 family glycosyltransferase